VPACSIVEVEQQGPVTPRPRHLASPLGRWGAGRERPAEARAPLSQCCTACRNTAETADVVQQAAKRLRASQSALTVLPARAAWKHRLSERTSGPSPASLLLNFCHVACASLGTCAAYFGLYCVCYLCVCRTVHTKQCRRDTGPVRHQASPQLNSGAVEALGLCLA